MTTATSRHDHFPRADPARRQRLRQAAADCGSGWLAEDGCAGGLLAAMDAMSGAAPDEAIAALLPWVDDTDWLAARMDAALALLAADRFARPPLQMLGGGDDDIGGLILAQRGAIRLSLQLYPFGGRAVRPTAALFIPGSAVIRILVAGGASAVRHHVDTSADEAAGVFIAAHAARCRTDTPRALVAGDVMRLDTTREAVSIVAADGDVLLLELSVQPPSSLPIRTYDIASGRLLQLSASRRDASFRIAALALLRTLGRRDAAPLFAIETRDDDFATRWSAMRELVALDPVAAHPRLAQMAVVDPHPEVRRAAAATLALIIPTEVG